MNAISIGCGEGWEALALALFLGVRECFGIDIDEDKIEVAHQNLSEMRGEPDSINAKLTHLQSYLNSSISVERELEENAYFLINRYLHLAIPKFICADLSELKLNDDIPFDHFDFIYCRRVIYHIFCDEHDPEMRKTQRSISLIAELAKPGAIVVSIEPETCLDEEQTAVILDGYFMDAGFDLFTDDRLLPLPLSTMLYRKT